VDEVLNIALLKEKVKNPFNLSIIENLNGTSSYGAQVNTSVG
jgi:hypothetical protein